MQAHDKSKKKQVTTSQNDDTKGLRLVSGDGRLATKNEVDDLANKLSDLSLMVRKIVSRDKFTPSPENAMDRVCSFCNNQGHSANRCARIPDREKKCRWCGRMGYIKVNCWPKKRAQSTRQDGTVILRKTFERSFRQYEPRERRSSRRSLRQRYCGNYKMELRWKIYRKAVENAPELFTNSVPFKPQTHNQSHFKQR